MIPSSVAVLGAGASSEAQTAEDLARSRTSGPCAARVASSSTLSLPSLMSVLLTSMSGITPGHVCTALSLTHTQHYIPNATIIVVSRPSMALRGFSSTPKVLNGRRLRDLRISKPGAIQRHSFSQDLERNLHYLNFVWGATPVGRECTVGEWNLCLSRKQSLNKPW
jgi:hypothetical protein